MSKSAISKDQWVSLFRKTGLDDEIMKNWHRHFEADYPEAHQAFLEWLGISENEIKMIRQM